ncbi:MAG: oxaloacetate decarboxylase [Halioglobus sp.]|nr:oxaloacetate decarboxylase [Halioglobus sp.]|tara:strand:- start:1596 stop:1835 length:240 start_codon:yes stop_codon:yes gene_type:complete
MLDDLLVQGLELMVFGMGTVLAFLSLLVLSTTVMSRCIARYFPQPETVADAPSVPAAPDPQTLAAIGAAIARHRASRPR